MTSFKKLSISAESALLAVQGAMAKARQLDFAMSIVVCDESGIEKLSMRMDGASQATLGIARDKAYTCTSLGSATHALWDMIKNDPPLQTGLPAVPRLVTFGGGYPIIEDGQIIGAIGVSGAHYSDDLEVARAGLAAIGSPVS